MDEEDMYQDKVQHMKLILFLSFAITALISNGSQI